MTHRNPWRIWLLFGVLALIAITAMSVVQRRLQTLHHESQQALNDERWEQAISLSLWRMEARATQIFRDLAAADTAPNEALTMKVVWIKDTLQPFDTDTVALNQQDSYGGFGNTDYGQQAEPTPQQAAPNLGKAKGGYDSSLDTQNRAGLNANQYGLQQQVVVPNQQAVVDPTQTTRSYPTSLIIERVEGQLICQRLHAPPEVPQPPEAPETFESDNAPPTDLSLAPWRTPRFLLDEQVISNSLLSACQDLLPNATLIPVANQADAPLDRQLASLPFAIDPGARTARYRANGNEAIWSTNFFSGVALLSALGLMTLLIAVLIKISQQRADFVAAVTHEMRTPLTTFLMYTEMLTNGMVPKENQSQYHQTLHNESIRLNRLIENVLAFARLERRKKTANAQDNTQPQSLESLLTPALPHLENLAERSNAIWTTDLPPDALATEVAINPTSLQQILINLVDNACKYAVTGETPTITLRLQREADHILLQVIDEGPGLTPAQVKRAFTAFQRANTQEQAKPGIGLGLALSRTLARQAGGDLIYQHLPDGTGSNFTIQLPSKTALGSASSQ